METVNIKVLEDIEILVLEEEPYEIYADTLSNAILYTEESTNSTIFDNLLKELDRKQDKVDDNLETTNKTVVGAINELRETIGVSGGGGDKEVIEVENEDALDQIEEPSKEVIYITADTGQLYIYDGEKFINVTNKQVGNTIYVGNIRDLIGREYENGLYIVETNRGKMYNLNVYGLFHMLRLYNHNGWAEVATKEDGEKDWKWYHYTYQEDIDALLPLIYAGL